MAGTRVAIFVDEPDWHSRRLAAAFQRRGVVVVPVSLRACGFDTSTRSGLILPGSEGTLPDAAFVRQISAGSFEQVTMRLGVLHALRELGVFVYNDARVAERCVDKSMTSFLLHRHGIPTLPTWTMESPDHVRALVEREAAPDRPLVLKPLFGSQGRGLRLVTGAGDLPPAEEIAGVYYVQRYAGPLRGGWRDWRVFVVGAQAVAAMIRHGVEWRTNAARGARCESTSATGEIAELAVAAAKAVGAGYAGVDIIADEGGRLHVLEVNSMPAWKALQTVTRIDIADLLAADLLSRIAEAQETHPAAAALCGAAGR